MFPASMALLLRKKTWWRVPIWFSGGEHIFRLVETYRSKENFLQSKNFLLNDAL
jgi:hypothetical protein